MKTFKSRTIALFAVWIMLMGAIIHVVEKDLLGLYPDFDLTSAFIMAFLGGALMLLPYIFRSEFLPLLGNGAESGSASDFLDLKTIFLSVVIFLAVSMGIHYSGLIPQFALGSALNTLWMGSVMILIFSVVKRIRSGKGKRGEPVASMGTESSMEP